MYSEVLEELKTILKTKTNLSTAFHPQADEQSEKPFRTLQEILRCFVTYSQKTGVSSYLVLNSHSTTMRRILPSVSFSVWNIDSTRSQSLISFIATRVLNTKETTNSSKKAKLAIEQANVRNADSAD